MVLLFAPMVAIAQTSPTARAVSLREVPKDRSLVLRVLYLEDRRLPTLSATQRNELYGKIGQLLHAWYGYDATLREVRQDDLVHYFEAQAAVFKSHWFTLRLRLDPAREDDRARLRAAIQGAVARADLGLVATHLESGPLETREQAATFAYERFLKRLPEILAVRVADGGPVADPARPELNSYMHWCALTHEMTEADMVFTNSLMAGADAEMALTQIGRGGITTGNTNANSHNAFGAAVVVTMFPFLSDAPFWLRERGRIPEGERLDVIATLAMHELGHMLQRIADHDRHPHCIYVPAVGLRYYDWHRAIREGGMCTLEHRRLEHY